MQKFLPSFILAFVLAVSFLAPVHDVLAESLVTTFRANIFPVSVTKKQTSNYGYICPQVALAQLSFFNRLLAVVGITRSLPVQNLAEATGCGEPGVITKAINAKWNCTVQTYKDTDGQRIYGCVNDNYSKSDKKTFSSARATTYGITSCTETHVYVNGTGTVTNSCAGPKAQPPSITKVNYPPEVDVNGIGSFRGRWLVGTNLVEDFSVTESVKTYLAAWHANRVWDMYGTLVPGYALYVPISVSLTQLVLNPKTNEFNYVPVSCTKITVAGKALDKNCRATLWVREDSPVDVTPTAPVPYYIYSVFVSGAVTEK